jgi:hypothetical protein
MNLAPESRVAQPSDALAQTRHAPEVLMIPASAAPPPQQVKQSRRRLWLVLGLVGALVLALCGGCAGTLYWAISSQLAPSQTGATILFQDTLLDSTSAWPNRQSECGYVTAGYLVNGAWCLADAGPFDNVDISVTVRQIEGAQAGFYGILFRQHDGQNAYVFDVSTDGSWTFQNISPIDLFPESPKHEIFVYPQRDQFIHTGGAANTLLVRAIGHHFTFFANNLKLGEADDTDSEPYTSGYLGLASTQGAQAAFTNLLVTRPR